ncbi:hypothetical protein CCGE525_01085 [Rhizobium jaguaris]|uniref:Uncharacterized protein n=1 Tax=Rhizobium jaguaris TaxID=1312183 RepID=A0A387FRZ9_9HYPH|nr:hypothetical protein CCGE525_01085 [Rhizobium jaguaris]
MQGMFPALDKNHSRRGSAHLKWWQSSLAGSMTSVMETSIAPDALPAVLALLWRKRMLLAKLLTLTRCFVIIRLVTNARLV